MRTPSLVGLSASSLAHSHSHKALRGVSIDRDELHVGLVKSGDHHHVHELFDELNVRGLLKALLDDYVVGCGWSDLIGRLEAVVADGYAGDLFSLIWEAATGDS